MSLSDPLGDMLTRIRNGQMRGKESVLMPASRFRGNVLDVLQREGYIKGFKKLDIENNKNEFQIELKYVDGEPVIKNISRVSTPGRRVYSKIKDTFVVAEKSTVLLSVTCTYFATKTFVIVVKGHLCNKTIYIYISLDLLGQQLHNEY